MPLQVGEPLAVDCSFGSAGGRPVPSTAAAGTRHRHPWLFQLVCGEGGRLEGGSQREHPLKIFEVQVLSAITGLCETSLRANFSMRCCASEERTEGVAWENRKIRGVKDMGSVSAAHDCDSGRLNTLEQHIARLQHRVFWEEVFETIKGEALVDGRDGWLAHHDARGGLGVLATQSGPKSHGTVASSGAGSKHRLVSGSGRGVSTGEQDAAAPVVHVLDDEVMVKMDNQFLLGYRLVPDGGTSEVPSEPIVACDTRAANDARARAYSAKGLTSLCRIALLYSASLLRQRQQVQAEARLSDLNPEADGEDVRGPATSVGDRWRPGTSGQILSCSKSIWSSVGQVLRHQLFCKEVSGV